MVSSLKNRSAGFTLIEVIVGVVVFLMVALSVYQAYISLSLLLGSTRVKIAALDLANEQFEIIRNLPYADVGISGAIPDGVLLHEQDLVRDGRTFTVLTTVRNYDDPFDGTIGGNPNDPSPADSKLVEVEIQCTLCRNYVPVTLTTRVSPKNLETASTNGALFIQVLNASGEPVPGASVHIENNSFSPSVVIDDVTDNDGFLRVVDVPPSNSSYEVTVTKDGYTTSQTYAAEDLGGSTPLSPHLTVVLQQVTQSSFIIDEQSGIAFKSVGPTCEIIPNISFTLTGSRLLGENPTLPKHEVLYSTNGSGALSVPNIEWDTYVFALNESSYDIVGSSPATLLTINPGALQEVELVLGSKKPNSLVIAVRDNVTGQPISDALVTVRDASGVVGTAITGRGSLTQTNWSGGSGQEVYSDETRFASSTGVSVNSPTGDITLQTIFDEEYRTSGELTSSIFDTGSPSNFHQIMWTPLTGPVEAGEESIRFQVATNASSTDTIWNFVGPDGTSNSYYTATEQDIHSSHNGDRYFRYHLFLSTDNDNVTPNISDISFTFTSLCVPLGQVYIPSLGSGEYTIEVEALGYQTKSDPVIIENEWTHYDMPLNRN